MAVDVQPSITIRKPRQEVAAYAFDPTNDPVWIGGISQVEVLTPLPVRKGTRVRRIAGFMGRRIEYTPEVIEYEPEKRLAMTTNVPFDMHITYSLEDAPEGTRMTIRIQGDAKGYFRLAGPLLGPMVRRNVAGDLRRLKRILEAQT